MFLFSHPKLYFPHFLCIIVYHINNSDKKVIVCHLAKKRLKFARRFWKTPSSWALSTIRGGWKRTPGTMGAVQDGQIIGFCGYGAYRGQEAESFGEIQGIYLLQAYQHRGIGQALLQAGVHALQAEGYQHIVLWVLHTNEKAITFYQKNGFSFDGHQKTADLGGRQKRLRFVYSE